jgi:hypothetical protein
MHEPIISVLSIAIAVAVVGTLIYGRTFGQRKRGEALADVALRTGLTFEAKVSKERLATLGSFHLFKRGHGGTARNLLTGKGDAGPMILLDYQYTTGGGNNAHTYQQTVAIFQDVAGLPEFTLAPEHFWHRIGSVFGYQDIDFETSREFSLHYLLRGPDETAIRARFGAEALGFFGQHRDWSVESCGGALAVYRSSKRVKPEEIPAFLADTAAVRRALGRD